jgi:hypothetical protein
MKSLRCLSVASLLLFGLAGCLPGGLPTAEAPARLTTAGPHTRAAVSVRVVPYAGGLQTKAIPKVLADVASYTMTLYDINNNPVAAGGALVNPISGPALTATFEDVPTGNDYYVTIEAFDGGAASITQGGPATSVNTVDIVNGQAIYSDNGTGLAVNLVLSSATPGVGSFGSTPIGGATAQFAGADRYGLALVNNVTGQVTANAVLATTTFGMNTVQQGAPAGPTHEIWAFSGQTGSPNLASPAKPFPTPPDGGGAIQPPTVTLAATPISTGNGGAAAIAAPGGSLTTDGAGDLYYWDGAGGQIMKATSGGSYIPSPWITGTTGNITLATDLGGNAFYSDGTYIMTQPAGAGPFPASNSTVALGVDDVGAIAVDELGNLFYVDTVAGTILKAKAIGAGVFAATTTVCAAPGTTSLGVDAYGNVYFTTGTDIEVATLGLDGYTYAAPTTIVSDDINSFAVDRAGNVYFTNGTDDVVTMAPAGPSRSTLFNVAGNGTATGVDNTAGVPTSQTLLSPTGLCVSPAGTLFFTSKGAGGVGDFIRLL